MSNKRSSLACRLRGHQWHTVSVEMVDLGKLSERKEVTTTFFALDYCARCGEPSPKLKVVKEASGG